MYIRSKWSDRGYRELSEMNFVGTLYGILGTYIEYCEESSTQQFREYYFINISEHPYHFRNRGERRIKNNLFSQGIRISRIDFRLLSKTYWQVPVISSDRMGIIFTELIDQILNFQETRDVLEYLLDNQNIDKTVGDFLSFQYYFVSNYVRVIGVATSYKKQKAFRKVVEEWENNSIFQ